MEKFAQFGVEPILLGAQIVNFLLLLYLLKRFLYKPVLGIIKKREDKIRQGLEAAAKGEELFKKASEEEKKRLQRASEEAHLILEQTRKRALLEADKITLAARAESEKIIEKAKAEIIEEREFAEKAFEAKIFDVATAVVAQILPKVLTKSDHIRILEESEKLLKKELS